MGKRVFFDTNILLDAILARENGSKALLLLDMCHAGMIQGHVAPIFYVNIAYILRKRDKEEVHSILNSISKNIKILPMSGSQFMSAMDYGAVDDFEDMMQYQCAKEGYCDIIITNNVKDFLPFCTLQVMNAEEFLTQLLENTI